MQSNNTSEPNNTTHGDVESIPAPSRDADAHERVEYLRQKAEARLNNMQHATGEPTYARDTEPYNRGVVEAAEWWKEATNSERELKREKVMKRETWLRKVFLKPPQFEWVNNRVVEKLRWYEGWSEVLKNGLVSN